MTIRLIPSGCLAALLSLAAIQSVSADTQPAPTEALQRRVAQLEAQVKALQEQIRRLEESAARKPVDVTIVPTELNRRVELKMKDPIPTNFEKNKLVNVFDYVRNTTGVNLYIDWACIEAAGIKQDTLITLQLNNASAETVLKMVLHDASGTKRESKEPLVHAIYDGMVVVSTKEGLAKLVEEKVRVKTEAPTKEKPASGKGGLGPTR